MNVLVFLGGTWKDGGNGHEEGMETVDLGGGLRTCHGRGTGSNVVLKPNCYIVVGFLYFT